MTKFNEQGFQDADSPDWEEYSKQINDLSRFNAGAGVRARLNNMEVAAEFAAFQYLSSVLQPKRYMPTVGGWSVQFQVVAHIIDHLLNHPKSNLNVVEVGSGMSTSWIGLALQEIGNSKLISLEHDMKYANKTRNQIKKYDLEDVVTLHLTDLIPHCIENKEYLWYDIKSIKDMLSFNDKIDLVFVDGPPGHIGRLSRYPAFELLSSYMKIGTRVVLDDTDRSEEKEVIQKWISDCSKLIPGHKLTEIEIVGRSTVLEVVSG